MDSILQEILIPLALGIAASLFVRVVRPGIGVAVGTGSVVTLVAIIAALHLPPFRVVTCDWCIKSDGAIRVTGMLGTLISGSPISHSSVQVKVYEAGHGDPPLRGPKTATTDAQGRFMTDLPALGGPDDGSYVLNIVYFYSTPFMGERWTKYDFKRGKPFGCPQS